MQQGLLQSREFLLSGHLRNNLLTPCIKTPTMSDFKLSVELRVGKLKPPISPRQPTAAGWHTVAEVSCQAGRSAEGGGPPSRNPGGAAGRPSTFSQLSYMEDASPYTHFPDQKTDTKSVNPTPPLIIKLVNSKAKTQMQIHHAPITFHSSCSADWLMWPSNTIR